MAIWFWLTAAFMGWSTFTYIVACVRAVRKGKPAGYLALGMLQVLAQLNIGIALAVSAFCWGK